MLAIEPKVIRIVIADDHKIVCDSLACFLEGENRISVVGKACNGEEALKMVEQTQPDIAILDVSMPVVNGIEAARRLKESHPNVSSIMLSMHGDSEHVYQALRAGARGYVLKECVGRELILAIRSVQDGGVYLAQSITSVVVSDYLRLRHDVGDEGRLSVLSSREIEVLKLQAEGVSTRDIAKKLHLSPKTVETYRYRIKDKLNIRENAGLVKLAIQEGLISLD